MMMLITKIFKNNYIKQFDFIPIRKKISKNLPLIRQKIIIMIKQKMN